MFNRQFIDQLRERGRQLAEKVEPEQTDLARGPQAETYEPDNATQPPEPPDHEH